MPLIQVSIISGRTLDQREALARRITDVVEETLSFTRHTGMPLETRGLIASYNTSDGTLLVHHSHQTPNEIQSMLATIFDLGQHRIRILSDRSEGCSQSLPLMTCLCSSVFVPQSASPRN